MTWQRYVAVGAAAVGVLLGLSSTNAEPLRVSGENPRYFADSQGHPVYLTGSHTWSNLVDMGPADPPYGRGSTHTSARLGTVVSTACIVALSRSKPWHTGNS